MARYRKKPIVVEAFPYWGPTPEFARWHEEHAKGPGGIEPVGVEGEPWAEPDWALRLLTVQGQWVTCKWGEVIVCEAVSGRFYPCAGDVFEATYEPIDAGVIG